MDKPARVKKLIRLLIISLPLIGAALVPPHREAQSQRATSFEKSIQPFLAKNCYSCHNGELKSGGLNLEGYKTMASVVRDRSQWHRVAQKLRTGEMPPKGMPRPSTSEITAVTGWIESELGSPKGLSQPDPGRVTARRLNRAEYNNTVRDLLGVDLQPADDFPQDDSGYGFDNIGDVLSLSPVLMEKYIASAEKLARSAVFGDQQLKPTLARYHPVGRRLDPSTTPLLDYDLTGLSLPNATHAHPHFPVEGEYLFRVFLGGVRPLGSEPLQIALWIDGTQVQVSSFDPEGIASFSDDKQDFGGMTTEFRARVSAGQHWIAASLLRLYEGLPASYNGPNPSKRPVIRPEFRPPPGISPERREEMRKRFEARIAEKVPVNEARIGPIEVGGPYSQIKGPSPRKQKLIYVCGHYDGRHQAGCARTIIASLARRAYRRPVSAQEVDQLTSLVSGVQKEGDSFDEGICVALQAMLVSPHFLFRIEKNAEQSSHGALRSLSQHELASRLSYFIWSSMPDEELLACADRGALTKPAILEAQVRRLLSDPKSKALVENFGGQWLELRRLESVKPDRQRFPQFEEYLRWSMRRETEMFFDSIIRQDRSILEFIDGPYTFLNERLARFYGVEGVTGPAFRRVALTPDSRRSGILTQASVLTVSSYATRTSPVLRGKWILENILNSPPPPPPPDVPNLDESKAANPASMRLQLEEHRKNTVCASCHARMDPLGFGLENFDAIGGWRSQDGSTAIDSSGVLPDGRSFKGPVELKAIVKADSAEFTQCMVEKLLTYALGRGLESYDKPVVADIASRVGASGHRFSSLVLEIAKSLPFQKRRGEPAK